MAHLGGLLRLHLVPGPLLDVLTCMLCTRECSHHCLMPPTDVTSGVEAAALREENARLREENARLHGPLGRAMARGAHADADAHAG